MGPVVFFRTVEMADTSKWKRRGARLWLSPLCAFVYSLVSLSRCRHVDTCTRSDSYLLCRSLPSSRLISRDASSVHDVGLVYLRSHPAVPVH